MSNESAAENLGPQLLGRVEPNEYQKRGDASFQMRDYLDARRKPKDFTALDSALDALKNQPGAAPTTKVFAQAVVDFLKGSTPSPTPTPTPTPDPTPTPTPTPSGSKYWPDSNQLDQGQTGHCVGFAGTQYRNAEPQPNTLTNQDGHDLYYACKENDGEPRAENGSTIHSLAQVLKAQGHILAYVWASTVDDIKAWVLDNGPVIVGVEWYNDMFKPDANFFVKPTGGVAGGHAFLIVGYDSSNDSFCFHNSWGKGWGNNGYFYMKASDFAKLLNANGEAMAAAELAA